MARRVATPSEPEDDLIAEVLSEAGMQPGHKSYKKKYRQLVRLEVSDYECELLLELPGGGKGDRHCPVRLSAHALGGRRD